MTVNINLLLIILIIKILGHDDDKVHRSREDILFALLVVDNLLRVDQLDGESLGCYENISESGDESQRRYSTPAPTVGVRGMASCQLNQLSLANLFHML